MPLNALASLLIFLQERRLPLSLCGWQMRNRLIYLPISSITEWFAIPMVNLRVISLAAPFVLCTSLFALSLVQAQSLPTKKKSDISAPAPQAKTVSLSNIPHAVATAFCETYPNAALVSATWVERNAETCIKLHTSEGTKTRDLLYRLSGELIEMAETISPIALPEAVKETIHEEFSRAEILSAKRLVSAAPTLYEVTLSFGAEKETLIYDAKGVLVRKVEHLPRAVQKAFEAQYPRAEILAFSKQDEDGFVRWVIESREGQSHREIVYAETGEVVAISERLFPIDLPEAIKETLAESFSGSTLITAKRLTQVQYHISVSDSSGSTMLALDATGKLLDMDAQSEHVLLSLATSPAPSQDLKAEEDAIAPIPVALPDPEVDLAVALKPIKVEEPLAAIAAEKKERPVIIVRRYYAPSLGWIPPIMRLWRPSWWW